MEELHPQEFTEADKLFIENLEAEVRNKQAILNYEAQLKEYDPEAYKAIAARASELAPGNPRLHAFYFTELLLLTAAVRQIDTTGQTDSSWVDSQPHYTWS